MINEQRRQKSPALQAYETAMEPIDYKIGLANVVLTCGIKSVAWYSGIVENLQHFRREPRFEQIRMQLSSEEIAEAQNYDQTVADAAVHLYAGANASRQSCQAIMEMPFTSGDVAFLP